MFTAFCGLLLHCDNHSLASFKDGANQPTAPTAARFVPCTESSHMVPASCCQLLPGQLLSQVSSRAHQCTVARPHPLRRGAALELPNSQQRCGNNKPDEAQRCCSLQCIWLENVSLMCLVQVTEFDTSVSVEMPLSKAFMAQRDVLLYIETYVLSCLPNCLCTKSFILMCLLTLTQQMEMNRSSLTFYC